MSSGDEDTDDKPFEASPKKLEDARQKGDIPRAADLNVAAAYAGLLLTFLTLGPMIVARTGSILQGILARADTLGGLILADGGRSVAGALMASVAAPLSALPLLPAAGILIVLIARRGFAPSKTKIEPKLSRISPLSNFKNKFGRSGLFEFFKNFVKLVVFSLVLGIYLSRHTEEMLASLYLEPGLAIALLGKLALGFLGIVLAIALIIGVIDALWQQADFLRRNRMTRKEMTDEHKQSEGDPHMKQQRRQRGHDIAMNKMLVDVPKADVIIVNPQHYAVALQWDRKRGTAPVCVAKGVDEIAARIREAAAEAGVPIHRDPPTARSLHATVEIGDTISREHYQAVAAAIRFADKMRSHGRR
ncbi:MAG: flagellar type III secretion system protein FlhB [Qingshengfaniella sp.]